ncbi:hypothetical protein CGRA01v4_02750 [Colletotrichum graminicola]|nr:hypothetical protein CGRA01v4_02750 [Colletotrichum graminicola]
MAQFHQCPWENCSQAREEVSVGIVSSPEDNFKLCELEDIKDSSSFSAPSQEDCSDVMSILEIGTSISEATSTKATSVTASSHPLSEKGKKPNTHCVHESSRYTWKLVDKRGQKCDLCAGVLPKFVLRCTRCNIRVCMMCGSRKGWISRRDQKNPPSNIRRWDSAH